MYAYIYNIVVDVEELIKVVDSAISCKSDNVMVSCLELRYYWMPALPLPSGVLRNPMLRPRERSDPQQPSKGKEKEAKGEKEEKRRKKRALGDSLAGRMQ